MLRLKNSDLVRENKELTEQCEEANSALRVKGRAHDQARQQVLADRDKVISDAETEAARIRQQAKDDADKIIKDTNLKAEAIDQLAREQAIAQARQMVQSATDETREIQNAHRLRLQDLKSRITEMEKARGEMMDYLAKVIGDLQKAQDYASRTAPLIVHKEDLEEADAEPQLDLSALKVDAAASALRDSETEPDAPARPAAADETTNRVVAPGMDDDEPRTNTVVTPSPDYFDTEPKAQPGDPNEEVEIPGAIFSYPILRQQGEPILDEGTPQEWISLRSPQERAADLPHIPYYLLYAADDTAILPRERVAFLTAMADAGQSVETVLVPGMAHCDLASHPQAEADYQVFILRQFS